VSSNIEAMASQNRGERGKEKGGGEPLWPRPFILTLNAEPEGGGEEKKRRGGLARQEANLLERISTSQREKRERPLKGGKKERLYAGLLHATVLFNPRCRFQGRGKSQGGGRGENLSRAPTSLPNSGQG